MAEASSLEADRGNAWLTNRIHDIHEESWGTYGAPRIHAELRDEGESAGLNRVARLMREVGLKGVNRRKGTVTTLQGDDSRPVPDLVDRDFAGSFYNPRRRHSALAYESPVSYERTHRSAA